MRQSSILLATSNNYFTPRFLAVPLLLLSMLFPHRAEIERVLSALVQEDEISRGTLTPMSQLRSPDRPNHRPSIASISVNLMWLMPKIKKFRPSCWFVGVLLLVVRLLQTSLMIIILEQKTQVDRRLV